MCPLLLADEKVPDVWILACYIVPSPPPPPTPTSFLLEKMLPGWIATCHDRNGSYYHKGKAGEGREVAVKQANIQMSGTYFVIGRLQERCGKTGRVADIVRVVRYIGNILLAHLTFVC